MSKKAVIKTGGHQYVVAKGDVLEVELVGAENKTLTFEPMAVIDGDKTKIGTPTVKGAKVTAKVVESDYKGDKIKVVKFKAKKNYRRNVGHRQRYSKIEITAV